MDGHAIYTEDHLVEQGKLASKLESRTGPITLTFHNPFAVERHVGALGLMGLTDDL